MNDVNELMETAVQRKEMPRFKKRAKQRRYHFHEDESHHPDDLNQSNETRKKRRLTYRDIPLLCTLPCAIRASTIPKNIKLFLRLSQDQLQFLTEAYPGIATFDHSKNPPQLVKVANRGFLKEHILHPLAPDKVGCFAIYTFPLPLSQQYPNSYILEMVTRRALRILEINLDDSGYLPQDCIPLAVRAQIDVTHDKVGYKLETSNMSNNPSDQQQQGRDVLWKPNDELFTKLALALSRKSQTTIFGTYNKVNVSQEMVGIVVRFPTNQYYLYMRPLLEIVELVKQKIKRKHKNYSKGTTEVQRKAGRLKERKAMLLTQTMGIKWIKPHQ